MKRAILIAALAAGIYSPGANAVIKRSNSARVHFVHATACPSTGVFKLPCPGWIIDHVVPLCAGGADSPSNMQWQTLKDSKIKDRQEKAYCASLRKAKNEH